MIKRNDQNLSNGQILLQNNIDLDQNAREYGRFAVKPQTAIVVSPLTLSEPPEPLAAMLP